MTREAPRLAAPPGEAAPLDAALAVDASRASVQEHVFLGLLHDLNGPLNNLVLTLALLERTLGAELGAEPGARARRYVAALGQEVARLAAWSREAAAALIPSAEGGPATTGALLHDAWRLLRHHATRCEVGLVVETGRDATLAEGAGARAALLAFVAAAIDLAPPGATVTLTGDERAHRAIVRIAVAPAKARGESTVPPTPVRAASAAGHLDAGRALVAALHGSTSMRTDGARTLLEITLPTA